MFFTSAETALIKTISVKIIWVKIYTIIPQIYVKTFTITTKICVKTFTITIKIWVKTFTITLKTWVKTSTIKTQIWVKTFYLYNKDLGQHLRHSAAQPVWYLWHHRTPGDWLQWTHSRQHLAEGCSSGHQQLSPLFPQSWAWLNKKITWIRCEETPRLKTALTKLFLIS